MLSSLSSVWRRRRREYASACPLSRTTKKAIKPCASAQRQNKHSEARPKPNQSKQKQVRLTKFIVNARAYYRWVPAWCFSVTCPNYELPNLEMLRDLWVKAIVYVRRVLGLRFWYTLKDLLKWNKRLPLDTRTRRTQRTIHIITQCLLVWLCVDSTQNYIVHETISEMVAKNEEWRMTTNQKKEKKRREWIPG